MSLKNDKNIVLPFFNPNVFVEINKVLYSLCNLIKPCQPKRHNNKK